jgi:hypothetical protein
MVYEIPPVNIICINVPYPKQGVTIDPQPIKLGYIK